MTLKGDWDSHRAPGSFRTRTAATDKKNGETRYVTVLLPATLYDKIADRARAYDIPVGSMTRKILERAID